MRECVVQSGKEKAKRYQPNVKDKQLRRDMVALKDLIERYERALRNDIDEIKVYKMLKEDVAEIYGDMVDLIRQSRQAFKQAIWHEGADFDGDTAELLGLCYVVRMVLRYSMDSDIETERKICEYLKDVGLRLQRQNPLWLGDLDRAMMAVTCTYYELPKDLCNDVIESCKRVLDNRIKGMNFEQYAVDSIEDLE